MSFSRAEKDIWYIQKGKKGSYISIMFSVLLSMFKVGSLINNHIITPMIDTEKGVPVSRINHAYRPGRW